MAVEIGYAQGTSPHDPTSCRDSGATSGSGPTDGTGNSVPNQQNMHDADSASVKLFLDGERRTNKCFSRLNENPDHGDARTLHKRMFWRIVVFDQATPRTMGVVGGFPFALGLTYRRTCVPYVEIFYTLLTPDRGRGHRRGCIGTRGRACGS